MSLPLIVYHARCADGFTAAWVAHRHHGGRCELVAARHGEDPPDVRGRDVVILDFSYRRQKLSAMHADAASLLVLDHHRSAERDLAGLPFARFDMERSGAGMAWDHYFPGQPRPWLVDYVEDRDLWRWALPDSRAVSAWSRTIDFELAAWDRLAAEPLAVVAERGRAILAYVDRVVADHVRHAAMVRLAGHVVPAVNATTETSEIGHVLAESAPFSVTWTEGPDGYHYSLRSSRENPAHVDVSENRGPLRRRRSPARGRLSKPAGGPRAGGGRARERLRPSAPAAQRQPRRRFSSVW